MHKAAFLFPFCESTWVMCLLSQQNFCLHKNYCARCSSFSWKQDLQLKCFSSSKFANCCLLVLLEANIIKMRSSHIFDVLKFSVLFQILKLFILSFIVIIFHPNCLVGVGRYFQQNFNSYRNVLIKIKVLSKIVKWKACAVCSIRGLHVLKYLKLFWALVLLGKMFECFACEIYLCTAT